MQVSPDPNAPLDVVSTDLDGKEIFDAIGRDEDEKLLRNTYRQCVHYQLIELLLILAVCARSSTREILQP